MKESEWKAAAWLVQRCGKMSGKAKLVFSRELRSMGVLPQDATIWLIGWEIISKFEDRFGKDSKSVRILAEMTAIERQHDREGGWPIGKGPKRYQAIVKEWDILRKESCEAAIRKAGENEMADLYRRNREWFEKTMQAGRDYFSREFRPEMTNEAADKRLAALNGKAA